MRSVSKKAVFPVLLLCFLLLFCGCGLCERWETGFPETSPVSTESTENTEEGSVAVDQWREDHGIGTCKTLEGDVAVVLFYINDFESEWTDEEISRFTAKEVQPGLRFLEQEAKLRGIELNLTVEECHSSIYYDDTVITSVENTGFASADVLWQAAVQINYPSSSKMIEALRKEYNTEEIVCITVFNKGGTSYALNPKKDADIKIDEHCIVFARELYSVQNGPDGSQSAVVAHEMLHLYGAEDFYAIPSRKSLAELYFPDDIMLSAAYDIGTNVIGDATAFYIGWTDTVPDVLRQSGW